jgi:L-threonylcarbamoyladenylate synthase
VKVIKLTNDNERAVLKEALFYLSQGKTVVYPTDTSYGLAANVYDGRAVDRVYKIKQRAIDKPIHVVVPSISFAKKLVYWNSRADLLARKFLPGPLSMALPTRLPNKHLKKLTTATDYLGIRMPNTLFVLKLVKKLQAPITATGANPARDVGGYDAYNIEEVLKQFEGLKYKPDLVIDAGQLKKVDPSTFIRITETEIEMIRPGPISMRKLQLVLRSK